MMNFCTKCASYYQQPGTCNCFAAETPLTFVRAPTLEEMVMRGVGQAGRGEEFEIDPDHHPVGEDYNVWMSRGSTSLN